MQRRTFLQRVSAATVVGTTGVAGCLNLGGDGGDGSDGRDGADGSGDDSGGATTSDGAGGAETATPTETATPAPTETPTPTAASLDQGARAAYDDWASAATYRAEEVQAFTVNTALLRAMSSDGTATPTPTPTPRGTPRPVDPVLGLPLTYLLVAAFSGFALVGFNAGSATGEGGGTEQIHSPGSGLVFEGSFDAETLAEQVGASNASEVGSYEGFTLYGRGSGEDRAVLGVSGEALVHASGGEDVSDPRGVVEATIDAGAGNATRYGADHGAYDDLVTALETQPIMGLGYSPDEPLNQETPTPTPTPTPAPGPSGSGGDFFNVGEFDLEGQVRGFATGLGFGPNQESATARMAIRYTSAGEVDPTDRIRSQAAPRATSVSVAADGPLVVVTADYSDARTL